MSFLMALLEKQANAMPKLNEDLNKELKEELNEELKEKY